MLAKHFAHAIQDGFIMLPAFILVFTIRGFSTALAALLMGDDTAREEGALTLNPLAHIDPIGLLILVVAFLILGGFGGGALGRSIMFAILAIIGAQWAYEVPINEHRFKHVHRGIIVTSLAGPLGNIVLALLMMYVITYYPFITAPQLLTVALVHVVPVTRDFALFYAVLGLVPIPPFNGARILPYILPKRLHHVIDWMNEHSFFIFIFLFILPGVSDIFFMLIHLMATGIHKFLTYLVI